MSKFAGEFKYILLRDDTLGDALTQMNAALLEDSSATRFITVAAIVLDSRRHEVEVVNAGHTDTLLRNADATVSVIESDVKRTPIGMFPGQCYASTKRTLLPGDTLVMFTDGLTDATRADNSLYGMDRVIQQVGHRRKSPGEIGLGLLNDVRQFVGEHPQSDDMCLVCVQRVG